MERPVKSFVAASLVVALTANAAWAQAPVQAPSAPLRAQLTSEVIKKAVTQTLADDKKESKLGQETALGAERYENFGRDFSEAKVPDCLHPDGLKRQPTFFLAGLLAVPFVLVAAVRGKCH